MKPLVIDTSVWVDWFRGRKDREGLTKITSGRVLYLPSVVVMELYSGTHETSSIRIMDSFIDSFLRNRRIIVPNEKDYITAGKILAELKWPASKLSNDTLIVVCARKIGAELLSLNRRDFVPLCSLLSVTLRTSINEDG
ncbi:MAG: PIN domain-containing protein [Deltaproteobacteria bacterium]|nr:PIN domain-containing protein [Deltaproteobacteria bacterium]